MTQQTFDTTTINLDDQLVPQADALELFYQGRVCRCTPATVPFHLGRDVQCPLVVDEEVVSRRHCYIDYYEGKFVLVDDSTNGTYVQMGRATPIKLHRESQALSGSGTIKLGRTLSLDDPELIHFKA